MDEPAAPMRPVEGTVVHHAAAVLAGARSHVHDPVGPAHHLEIVLDDEQRVARTLELIERGEQGLGVRGMQSRRGLVEHVDDAEEIRADLRGEPQALQFAR